jgi:hypothetical protein
MAKEVAGHAVLDQEVEESRQESERGRSPLASPRKLKREELNTPPGGACSSHARIRREAAQVQLQKHKPKRMLLPLRKEKIMHVGDKNSYDRRSVSDG